MSTDNTVILADDHEVVRAGLRDALQRFEPGLLILEAASLDEVFERLKSGVTPALVLLDLYMPGMNGMDGIRSVKQAAPETPVAIVSGSVRQSDIQDAVDAGAAGFIPKTMKLAAMAGAIRLIMSGETYLPYPLVRRDDRVAHRLLRPREREVVQAVARGMSNREIAQVLGIEEVTVKLHLSRAFRKLGVSNRTQAALKAQELSLV